MHMIGELSPVAVVMTLALLGVVLAIFSTDTGVLAVGVACLLIISFGPLFVGALAFGATTVVAALLGLIGATIAFAMVRRRF